MRAQCHTLDCGCDHVVEIETSGIGGRYVTRACWVHMFEAARSVTQAAAVRPSANAQYETEQHEAAR